MRKLYNVLFIFLIILIIKSNNKSLKKRNLSESEFVAKDLKIYLDFPSFQTDFENANIGDTETRTIFENSMTEAETKLERTFLINADDSPNAAGFIYEDFKELMGISSWNADIFEPSDSWLRVGENNLYILFKFDNLNNVDMFSKIVLTYAENNMPLVGLVTINKNIDRSKLNEEYLTLLFLQQFIKILGFQIPSQYERGEFEGPITADLEDDENALEYSGADNALVNKDKAEKVINYAKEYFACNSIEEIELELDDYNNVYWPSKIFSADIMTKFNSYQKKFISGFTLALLEDTGYIKVREDYAYTDGLMISGKNQGCECFFSGNCKIESDDDDDDKLSTGAIIGIVFGCVGFILIVLGIICFILKKRKKDNQITQLNNEEKIVEEKLGGDGVCGNNNNQQHEDKIQIEDIDKQNQVEIHNNAKRKISNK